MRQLMVYGVLAASALAFSGCGSICGNDEERTVTFSTDPSLAITRPADSFSLSMAGTIENARPSDIFDPIFRVVDDNATLGQAIQITMGGRHPVTDELVSLTLVLPTPVREGTTITVDSAFPVPFGVPSDASQNWGLKPAPSGGRGAAAFRTGIYTFPPAAVTDTYVAVGVTGTVRVVERFGEGFQLALDLTFRNASGGQTTVRGNAQVVTSRYTPPCIS